MYKYQLFVFLLAGSLSVNAQKNGSTAVVSQDQIVFKNALQYNDLSTAIQAAHKLIAKEGDTSSFKDVLAVLYFRANNYVSAHLVAKDLLSRKPKDIALLEINAVSLKSLNASKEAIAAYETLLPLSKNRFHAYDLAQLQLSMSRNGEAMQTIDFALANTQSIKDATLSFPKNENEAQAVPLDAALNNLKGLIAFELKDEATAKAAFAEALKLFPEFVLAKKNSESLAQLQNANSKDKSAGKNQESAQQKD